MSRLSVSSIKLIPYLNDDVKYDVELCNWVYQVVYTRAVETEDGDLKLIPMGDVSSFTGSLVCAVLLFDSNSFIFRSCQKHSQVLQPWIRLYRNRNLVR